MEAIRELDRPDWLTLKEASDYLQISRQAVGRVAIRLRWQRRTVANVLLLSRIAVEHYYETRQPSGPRKLRPPAAAAS